MSEEDPKAENIMNSVYVGKEATQCDGMIYGYSNFMHILTSKPINLTEPDFHKIITLDYGGINTEVDYTFQHKYRSRSINMFFLKDFFFALIVCLITYLIFDDYLNKFRGKDVYFQQMSNGTWFVCNDEDNCFGNGNYDFESLTVRDDVALFRNEKLTNPNLT